MSNFPIGASITVADLEGDIAPLLQRLRISEPVSWIPALQAWLVTRHDLAIAVMRDATTYTVDHPAFSTARIIGPSMLSLDGEEHLLHRTPFERPFRPRNVRARFDGTVARQVKDLVDGFAADGRAELRRDYAGPVAVQTMIGLLGLTDLPATTLFDTYDTIVDAVTRASMGEPIPSTGKASFAALSEILQPSLKEQPTASLLAAAAAMAQGLSDEQIISNAAVLLFGGIETTEGMIANALYFLLTTPKVLADLRADPMAIPTAIPAIIEESLRMEPAASVVDRYATQDVALGNVLIKTGDLVRVSLVGANRDPAIFDEPDRFDPTRSNLRSHVAFAQGPHICLGLHLARLEACSALAELLTRLPNLRLESTERALQLAKPQGLIFRKPRALQVRWDL